MIGKRVFILAGLALVPLSLPGGCGAPFPQPPTVTTSTMRIGGDDSLTVQFDADASDPDGGPVRLRWDFLDGQPRMEATVVYTFPSPGHYEVRLTVTDDEGEETRVSLRLNVPISGQGIPERAVPNEGREHVPVGTVVAYLTNPPASGSHYSQSGIAPVAAGVYSEALQPERWVHNLEHGYIVFLYDCADGCPTPAELQELFDLMPASKFGNKKAVITQYPGLGPFMMAIAWDVQLDFSTPDTAGLRAFYQRHVDRGPEDLP